VAYQVMHRVCDLLALLPVNDTLTLRVQDARTTDGTSSIAGASTFATLGQPSWFRILAALPVAGAWGSGCLL